MASIYSFWTELFNNRSLDLELTELAYGKENVFINENEEYQITSLVSTIPIDQAFLEKDNYYLVRGRQDKLQKICLVHECFFGNVLVEDLTSKMFSEIFDEDLADLTEKEKGIVKRVAQFQQVASPSVLEKASVALKYQVEVEVKPEVNIFDPNQYPEILDDTLNLICPFHSEDEKEELISNVASVIGTDQLGKLNIFPIKHPLNGWFLVFQIGL